MGVAKKGRRILMYEEKEYIWWVREEADDCGKPWLTVISPDKSLVLSYRVGEGDFFIVSKGRIFQGKETSGKWEYYWYPFSGSPPMVITPKFVREFLEWAIHGRDAEKCQ